MKNLQLVLGHPDENAVLNSGLYASIIDSHLVVLDMRWAVRSSVIWREPGP
jgi:hypothetical protein